MTYPRRDSSGPMALSGRVGHADHEGMKRLAFAAAAVLALAGCASSPTVAEPQQSSTAGSSILAKYDLAGLDGRAIVDRLDRTPVAARPADLRVSVRPGELRLSEVNSDASTVVNLPDDVFYLSVAPYVEKTHECYFHSLTTCRGELAGKPVHITITERTTGKVLVDEVTTTFDNGFVGFWLPRGITATMRVEHGRYAASKDISTGPEDPTCLTTVHLVQSA